MQNNIFITVISVIITLGSLSSCKKDEVKDTEKPVITVSEPLSNDTILLSVEDSIHIQFNASDNDELHEVFVNITNASGTNLFTNSVDVDEKTYSFHEHFHPIGITNVTPFTLKIDASDHNSNVESKTVTFFVRP